MYIHNLDPILIDLGLFQIRWYSVAYILGIVFGWVYANKIIKLTRENKYSFKQITIQQFDGLIVYLVVGIILGGTLNVTLLYKIHLWIFSSIAMLIYVIISTILEYMINFSKAV